MRCGQFVLGSALFLVGCSATAPGSLQVPGPQVPPAWQGLPAAAGPVGATSLAQWWLRFNDPLSALGGLVGIVVATAASYVGARLMAVPYVFDPSINLLSLLFSAAIGVLFGYFPARRAARLDPIEALRHE